MNEYTRVFLEGYGDSVFEPVEEGWGYVASFLVPIIGPLAHAYLSFKECKKIMANPKIKKYVLGECDRIYREVKKQGYSNECEMTKFNASRGKAMSDGITFKNHLFNHLIDFTAYGKYWIAYIGDTDHVEKIVVFFMNKEEKFITRTIPAPSAEDLKALGFRKEDSFD